MSARWQPSRTVLAVLAVFAVIAALSTLGCKQPAAEPDLRAVATRAASEIHAALPPERPGYGTTDYPGHAEGDVPKSYAMVLLAELDRRGRGWRTDEANLARVAGHWLLDHADSNGDGVVGWGLPVAWDAYDDGSTNPAHTEYTITTAIVIDALLTWAERDAAAPRERIRAVVQAAVQPYLDGRNASPSGMAPYSLAAADRRYDTFNPAAYLAGQIQRASLELDDARERARYLAAADATMLALLQHRQLAPGSGHWYWNYSVQQALPNDLPHAGYVIAGVRAYLEHGGRLAERFDWYAVLHHLEDFRGDAGEVRAFPNFRKGLKLAARSYDLGFALHLACTETRAASLVPWLLAAVEGYRTPRARYLKYPRGSAAAPAAAPALVVNEYEAYLYRGLTACALASARPPAPAASHVKLAAGPETAALAGRLAAGSGEASGQGSTARSAGPSARPSARLSARPSAGLSAGRSTDPARAALASPRDPRPAGRAGPAASAPVVPLLAAAAGLVSFDSIRRPVWTREDGTRIALPMPGVPVKTLAHGEAAYVFHRRYPDDRLWLLRYERERLVCQVEVSHGDDATAVASLRAATLHGARLHAVVYHNPSQANWHMAWDTGGTCPTRLGAAARLPSLQEPAGSTYEMIPSLHFHVVGAAGERGGQLWLAGGNMQVAIGERGPVPEVRVQGCRHIVESAPTPGGLAHLCVGAAVDADSGARRPVVVAPEGVAAPAVDLALGVPWNLQWSLGALQIDHARGPSALRRLLRRDLAATAPGGWMEFGINNEEGRIPWSQIYYLNGLLDLLDLARRDEALLDLYGPLLPEVRRRLDQEMAWLDAHVAAGRHHTRAFTVDRSRALFGVQTGRFLLVMHRYLKELPDPLPLPSYADLRQAVQRLAGHIEVLATEGEDPRWIRPGLHHLRWPKGSKFYFDGMPVPYNHQNEWAYAVLATADDQTPTEIQRAATNVISHFIDRIAPAARLPAAGAWDYWWGRAYDGWNEPGRYSVNVPRYGGDRIKAWISFRTIDAMSLVAGATRLGPEAAANARASAQALAARGLLYPFANHAWVDEGAIHLGTPAALEYARVSAPWELGSAVWSAAVLAKRWRGDF